LRWSFLSSSISVGDSVSSIDSAKIINLLFIRNLNLFDYNLGFGDKDPITGKINDKVVTNNGDTEKVLATVVSTVFTFTERNPNAYIYATGSNHVRNRLYRRGITKYLSEALDTFAIYGMLPNQEFEIFNPNTDYVGFLLHLKNN